jgi:hypothetical protein
MNISRLVVGVIALFIITTLVRVATAFALV